MPRSTGAIWRLNACFKYVLIYLEGRMPVGETTNESEPVNFHVLVHPTSGCQQQARGELKTGA